MSGIAARWRGPRPSRVFLIAFAFVIPGSAFAAVPALDLAPAAQQVLHKGNYSEPESLDPQKATGVTAHNILRDLYEGLVGEAPDGSLVPGGAVSWSVSDNGLRYIFQLRRDASWSNGDPVTAQDYVAGLRRGVDAATGSQYAQMLMPIKGAASIVSGLAPPSALGVRALDEYTLELRLATPAPYVLSLLTHPVCYPIHRASLKKYGAAFTRPGKLISNGAYTLSEWAVQSHIELVRNRHYWDDAHTVVNAVSYYPTENLSAELKRYRAGEIDWTYDIPVSQIDWIREHLPGELHIDPYFGLYFYGFNLTQPPFDNADLRKALTLAVDRDTLLNKVRGLGETAAYGWIPPGTPGYEAARPEWADWTQAKRDAEALRLYRKAGYSEQNPLQIELRYNTHEDHRRIAIVLSYMWRKALGVQTRLVNEEWKVFLQNRRFKKVTQVFRSSWIGDYNDPFAFLELLKTGHGANDYGYSNPEYDQLLAEISAERDPQQRLQLMSQAERMVIRDLPVLPIYFYTTKRLIKPCVAGVVPNVMDHQYTKSVRILAH